MEAPHIRGGHANARGLNRYGVVLLEEMMARGLIIDVDHMSEKATDTALDMAEQHRYPVICSHSWFRDLLFSSETEFDTLKHEHYGTSDVHKVAHEAAKRGDQIERIGKLGGVVAPILNQGDIAGLKRCEPRPGSAKYPSRAPAPALPGLRPISTPWRRWGAAAWPLVPISTGPPACRGRALGRRRLMAQITTRSASRSGAAKSMPRRMGWLMANPSATTAGTASTAAAPGGYDEEECDIWQAITQYKAGFNPATDERLETDRPESKFRQMWEMLHGGRSAAWVDNVTVGFSDEPGTRYGTG